MDDYYLELIETYYPEYTEVNPIIPLIDRVTKLITKEYWNHFLIFFKIIDTELSKEIVKIILLFLIHHDHRVQQALKCRK